MSEKWCSRHEDLDDCAEVMKTCYLRVFVVGIDVGVDVCLHLDEQCEFGEDHTHVEGCPKGWDKR